MQTPDDPAAQDPRAQDPSDPVPVDKDDPQGDRTDGAGAPAHHQPDEHQPEHDQAGRDRPAHNETGLDLARSVARSLAGSKRPARKRSGSPRPGQRPKRADPKASGAHPDDRDPQLLDTTIGRLIAEQGWSTDVRVHGVFSRWEHLVGREVAQHCLPMAFAEGKLVVRTDSTAWATQMRLLAPTVVRRLNEELGNGTVVLIDVQGPVGPNWRKGRRSVRDGRGPRDTYG